MARGSEKFPPGSWQLDYKSSITGFEYYVSHCDLTYCRQLGWHPAIAINVGFYTLRELDLCLLDRGGFIRIWPQFVNYPNAHLPIISLDDTGYKTLQVPVAEADCIARIYHLEFMEGSLPPAVDAIRRGGWRRQLRRKVESGS